MARVQVIVEAAAREKLLVPSGLDYLPVAQDKYKVGVHDGGKPVRDDEAGAAAHELIHRLLDKDLGARIDIRGRLVEYQQAAIRQQRAGD